MHQFEHLPHTADLCLRLSADSFGGLFRAGLRGMSDILLPDGCRETPALTIERRLDTRSVDRTALLIDFLSDVLVATFAEQAIFCTLDILAIDETRIEAIIRGYPVEEYADDIKAATYHDADVQRDKRGIWTTLVIFDI